MMGVGGTARRIGVGLLALTIQIGPALLIFGGWRRLADNSARRTLGLLAVAAAISAAVNGLNMAAGQREMTHQRRAIVMIFGSILLGRILSPISDRFGVLTVPGGPIRWLGILSTAVGAVLFEWSRYVMGKQYSFMAAIQKDHELVIGGPYQWVRHPGYASLLYFQLGYALVFRSLLGLITLIPLARALLWRIEDEEVLLTSEFGDRYERLKERTARFLPYVY